MAKKGNYSREQRRMRTNQIIFSVIAVLLIVSWILALITK
jgi:predicted nucleic acid-binding Zn ribbon protein